MKKLIIIILFITLLTGASIYGQEKTSPDSLNNYSGIVQARYQSDGKAVADRGLFAIRIEPIDYFEFKRLTKDTEYFPFFHKQAMYYFYPDDILKIERNSVQEKLGRHYVLYKDICGIYRAKYIHHKKGK